MAKKKLARLKISGRLLRKKARRLSFAPKKHCRFCASTQASNMIDYKNITILKNFLTERGKILPSRISGVCCHHQRDLAKTVRKSRTMALLPYYAPEF